jgi:hypothetical protein
MFKNHVKLFIIFFYRMKILISIQNPTILSRTIIKMIVSIKNLDKSFTFSIIYFE